jgi:hypothetical protein
MTGPNHGATAACFLFATSIILSLVPVATAGKTWRQLTEAELKTVIPERTVVENEQIETELRSASGIKDGDGRLVVAAALITAGYSAEGKYSHWLSARATLTSGDLALSPGDYVVGYRSNGGRSLLVSFYQASTGRLVGAAIARKESLSGPIRSIYIWPAGESKFNVQIGRFTLRFAVAD